MTEFEPFLPFKSDAKDAPAYWLLDLLWIVHVTGDRGAVLGNRAVHARGLRPAPPRATPTRTRRSMSWRAR